MKLKFYAAAAPTAPETIKLKLKLSSLFVFVELGTGRWWLVDGSLELAVSSRVLANSLAKAGPWSCDAT